ncbi:MAG: hypothetical protein OK456_07520 [Thaumarchaeota archaeon]|nr:hypothetical protein [Nitrososphaerota archaeon]
MVGDWAPTPQVPLAFGQVIACGFSGDIVTGPVDLPVYGPTARVTLRFSIPSQQQQISVAVCARAVGSPAGPLVFTLQVDNNGSPGETLASGTLDPAQVPSAAPGWTPFLPLAPGRDFLAAGYYWLIVTSPDSDASGYYLGCINFQQSWIDNSAVGGYQPPAGMGGNNTGTSVIWVQDPAGNDLTIMPFGQAILPPPSMNFTAERNYQINGVVPWLSDMHFVFKSNPASWTLTDVTSGAVLGVAPASQYYNSHGMGGILPFQFLAPVTIVAGHDYKIGVNDPLDVYSTLLRGSTCNPTKVAPEGVSPYWYGEIILADFSAYRVLDYPGPQTVDGFDPIGSSRRGNTLLGVRFVPNFDEGLAEVKLKMKSFSKTGNYAGGTPVLVSVYEGNDNAPGLIGAAPMGASLSSITVDSSLIPTNGWFEVSGLDVALSAGEPYWIVWSAPTSAPGVAFNWQRDVSPFRFLALVSTDAGVTWGYFADGPSEISWGATLSQETIANPFDDGLQATIDSSLNMVAQPFILSGAATVTSVFVYLVYTSRTNDFFVNAAIYPDNGSGSGPDLSSTPLGSGSFNTALKYFNSSVILSLENPAPLLANTKYWIVYSTTNGTAYVAIDYYWMRPIDPPVPSGYEALTSQDGGQTWNPAHPTEVATTIFMVGVQPGGSGVDLIPTSVSVTARPH